jgi:F0F1-type ATP synthase membrane subunit c/vacuolar-type H+-ATPase subunit K
MAAGQYYIDKNDILYYDDGSGFKAKGNTGGLTNGKPVNPAVMDYIGGTAVDPITKNPKTSQPDSVEEVKNTYNVGGAKPQFTYGGDDLPTPGSLGSLRYPSEPGTFDNSDYMIFEFYNYVPPFSAGKGGGLFTLEAYNSTARKKGLGKSVGPQIVLYMPEDLSVSYKAEWTGKKFSNIGAGLLQGAGNVGAGDIGKALGNLASTAGGVVKKAPTQIGAAAVSAIVNSITGESISQSDIFSSIGGQILNPNTELIFGGHDLRTFIFTYKLVAYNQPEAQLIKKIIDSFKVAMLPSFSADTQLAYDKILSGGEFEGGEDIKNQVGFIKNPQLVQPYFMHKSGVHSYLPRLKPCTITDFDVNYTADGVYAAHNDGAPVSATITISLLETKLVYSEDILLGF